MRDTPKFSRRRFLKVSAAAGVALSVPWLPGCEDDSNSSVNESTAPPGREIRRLHFDLSNYDERATYRLTAIGSQSDGAELFPETPASLTLLRAQSPQYDDVPDGRLTHQLGGIDLPAN